MQNTVKFKVKEDGTLDPYRITGHLVVFSGPEEKDLVGEYFTKDSDLGTDVYPMLPLMFSHGLDETLRHQPVGLIDVKETTERGLWVEAQLDKHHEYIEAIQELIEMGVLGWSSGAWPQAVSVEKGGWIKRWPIIEGSLTPTPAEPKTIGDITVSRDKSIVDVIGGTIWKNIDEKRITQTYEELVQSFEILKGADVKETEASTEDESDGVEIEEALPVEPEQDQDNEVIDMPTKEEILAMLDARDAAKAEAAKQQENADKAAQLDALLAKQKEDETASAANTPAKTLPGATGSVAEIETESDEPYIIVGSAYDHLTAEDMAWGVQMMKSVVRQDQSRPTVSAKFANGLAAKLDQRGIRVQNQKGGFYKANELSHSTQSSYGDEWVPTLWENELWRLARVDNPILSMFRSVEMPSNPYILPVEGTDPTVYFVPETTAEAELLLSGSGSVIPDSKVGSAQVTLTAKKLALRVGFSAELTEDSIVPILSMYREQAMRAMMDTIDYTILNGDTTNAGTGNINLDDADPADTKPYLAFDGLRHLPLVTTTANAISASGAAPSLALMRRARFTMAHQYSARPGNLAWIFDASSYAKLLNLDEYLTVDKAGTGATAQTGMVGSIDGIPVAVSAEMGLTEADGKISTTGGNNLYGQGVCVYKPGWIVGYRRRIATSMTYLPFYDSYQMTATVRIALVNQTADVASALYYIGV